MGKVRIGGNEQTIADFSAAKAMEAGGLVSAIIQKASNIDQAMNEYAAGRRQATAVSVSRAALYFENPDAADRIPEAAWAASNNVIELPGRMPSFEEQLFAVFPQVFPLVRDEVFKLLALVLVDDRELEEAETAGGQDGVTELLNAKGRELRYRAKLEEVFGLGAAAWEHCQKQLQADPTARALLTRLAALRQTQSPEPSSGPASSTGSPAGTAGPAAKSSTGSRGKSSSRSAA